MQVYLESLRELQRAALSCFYVQGNHDRADTPWASLAGGAQEVIRGFSLGGYKVGGLSFSKQVSDPAFLRDATRGLDIFLAHQSWKEIQKVGHTDATLEHVHCPMVLTGDYHVQLTEKCEGGDGPVTAHSPGSTAMQAINEPEDKYFGVLNDDGVVAFVKLRTRPVLRYLLTGDEELEDFCRTIAPAIDQVSAAAASQVKKPIVQVKYSELLANAYERVNAAVGSAGFLFLQPQIDKAHVTVSLDKDQFIGLAEAARQLATDATVGEDAASLVRAADSPHAIAELRTSFMDREQSAL